MYRIIQEELSNMARHSRAAIGRISLRKRAGGVELVIRDNWCGFDPTGLLCTDKGHKGVGLTAMEQRTRLSGGTFYVDSIPEKGTKILATWPNRMIESDES